MFWQVAAVLGSTMPLLFVVMITIGIVVSRIGGWNQLGEKFRCTDPVTGTSWGLQSAEFRRGVSYGGGLRFTLTDRGLHLTCIPIFRIGHPPVLIPWQEIDAYPYRGKFGTTYVELRFKSVPDVPIYLPYKLAAKMLAAGAPLNLHLEES